MREVIPSPLLQVIRRAAEDGRLAALPDQELLRLFREHADADAFHALLRRHGPMVLDVCRAVAATDAEDPFQATFLVLVRNAGGIPTDARKVHGTSQQAWMLSANRPLQPRYVT
jgi:hypothetical protein